MMPSRHGGDRIDCMYCCRPLAVCIEDNCAAARDVSAADEHIAVDHDRLIRMGEVNYGLVRLADDALGVLASVRMDTAEERDMHAQVVAALRGRLAASRAAVQGMTKELAAEKGLGE